MEKSVIQVLRRDLTARQPYHVKVVTKDSETPLEVITLHGDKVIVKSGDSVEGSDQMELDIKEDGVRPLLFPLSKLIEPNYSFDIPFETLLDELISLLNQCNLGRVISRKNFNYQSFGVLWFCNMSPYECVPHQAMDIVIDFLDSHYIDHRGLIEHGAAVDCTHLHIY